MRRRECTNLTIECLSLCLRRIHRGNLEPPNANTAFASPDTTKGKISTSLREQWPKP
jgi:hypothetical protein